MIEVIHSTTQLFDRPIIILSAPRSGSTLLFELLSVSGSLWTIGSESHRVIDAVPALQPCPANNYSNRLTEVDATLELAERLRKAFLSELRSHDGRRYNNDSQTPVRFLEKTPKNALRIPFLDTVFPGARFIYLYRDPRENISSIMEGWRSGRFVTYPQLSVFAGAWSFLLPVGWASMRTCPCAPVGRATAGIGWVHDRTRASLPERLAGLPGRRGPRRSPRRRRPRGGRRDLHGHHGSER